MNHPILPYATDLSNCQYMAKERIVIVGAGIVGVCCAYFITQHPSYDPEKYEIVIFEAVRPACAASGKAGGLLSRSAFPQQIVPLSFALHAELAEKYNGAEAWGFRHLTTFSIEGVKAASSQRKVHADLPPDLDWIDSEIVTYAEKLGGPDTYAQVHPYLFTTYLLRKVLENANTEIIHGRVTQLHGDRASAKAEGLSYISEDSPSEKTLKADSIIVTAGPWTSQLMPSCPVVALKAHSITLQPTRQVSAYALFTELRLSRHQYVSPEIYARKDEIFVSGEGLAEPLPLTADKVVPESEKCDALFKHAGELSREIRGGRVLRKQACFLPVVDSMSCTGPFIGSTNVDKLLVATGHSCWGINNAPGTGKVIAEILFDGKATSADPSGLIPKDFFDSRSVLTPWKG